MEVYSCAKVLLFTQATGAECFPKILAHRVYKFPRKRKLKSVFLTGHLLSYGIYSSFHQSRNSDSILGRRRIEMDSLVITEEFELRLGACSLFGYF
jgi:hypothetical protein